MRIYTYKRIGTLWRSLLLAALVSVALCGAVRAADSPAFDGYLVALKQETTQPGLLRAPLRTPMHAFSAIDSLDYVAEGLYHTNDADLAQALLDSGAALYVEPNYIVTLDDDVPEAVLSAAVDQWAYRLLGADFAADTFGLDGTGVRIGIVDSGVVPTNPNLAGANILKGWNYVDNNEDTTDTVGHGTYVTQTIVGTGAGGVQGVAPRAEIVPLRCFSEKDSTDLAILAKAIEDAVSVYHCDIINLSFGTKTASSAIHTAVQKANAAGVIVVAAAGNTDSYAPQGTIMYPAAFEEVIGVGAVTQNMESSDKTQQTEAVYVCAPGISIPFVEYNGSKTLSGTGTSFSSPFVAAELALLRQLMPGLQPAAAAALLKERAEDLGDAGKDTQFGWGFVNMKKLLASPWYQLTTRSETASAVGWVESGATHLLLASYSSNGRMTALAAYEIPAHAATAVGFRLTCAAEGAGGRAALFFLDSDYTPVKSL